MDLLVTTGASGRPERKYICNELKPVRPLTREHNTVTASLVGGGGGGGGDEGSTGVVTKPSSLYRPDDELLQHRPAVSWLHCLHLLPVLGPDDGGGGAGVHQAGQGGRED